MAPGAGRKVIPMIGTVKVSGSDSGGSFELIEYVGPAVPPPHVHRQRDEAFYVLEGTFRFILGAEEFEAGPGSLVHVPRGTRHGFRTGSSARALLFVAPAGLEGFFDELGEGLAAGRSSAELRAALSGRFDSEPA
jgi:quercetin dioxygenase-like cupin family protein